MRQSADGAALSLKARGLDKGGTGNHDSAIGAVNKPIWGLGLP